ncbi:MAG: hypothetical protein C4K49_02785 [Candidatus Thorarchaeota archaeon]|nr:MAG: hypothetical protein C4K49_02785 [Candidatus Thorarchaeota archaeon]
MLTDVELFVVTWVLAFVSIAAIILGIYASLNLFGHQHTVEERLKRGMNKPRLTRSQATTVQKLAVGIFIAATTTGMIVDFTSWLPVTDWNPGTELFRVMRFTFALFGLLLTFGSLLMCVFYQTARMRAIEIN